MPHDGTSTDPSLGVPSVVVTVTEQLPESAHDEALVPDTQVDVCRATLANQKGEGFEGASEQHVTENHNYELVKQFSRNSRESQTGV